MKKINSIGYGPGILACGLIFAVPVPLLLYLVYALSGKNAIIMTCLKASAGIGILILFSLAILLVIELNQDKRINKLYDRKDRFTKIKISDGRFECQSCGNNNVRESDDSCPICGNKFINL